MGLSANVPTVNLGKWVLRNLFSKLIDEEIKRDEAHRSTLRNPTTSTGLVRPGAPTSIAMPESAEATPMVSPGQILTPRASNGNALVPPTPSLAIGAATPGFAPLSMTLPPTAEEDSEWTTNGVSSPAAPTPSAATESQTDYFSSTNRSEASSDHAKLPDTPGGLDAPLSTPTSPTEERKKGLFGKKFPMTFPKKMTRTSVEVKTPLAPEEKSDTASYKSSEKEDVTSKVIEDNFYGVIQKIRHEYEEHLEHKPDVPVPVGITPSLPMETPVLRPPEHTTIIIQEDDPASGGLADQYSGEIGELGSAEQVDVLEKIAPMWLGEVLLKVRMRVMSHRRDEPCFPRGRVRAELTILDIVESTPLQGNSQSVVRAASLRQSIAQYRVERRQCKTECESDAPSEEDHGVRRGTDRGADVAHDWSGAWSWS